MNDCYNHNDEQVFYIVENIPGSEEESPGYEQLLNDYNSQLINHCECSAFCTYPTCKCLQNSSGCNYYKTCYVAHSKYVLNPEKNFTIHPIVECNSLCQCSNDCGNRVVQKGPINGLCVKDCDKGFGLFTDGSLQIEAGTFICEYAGEIITKTEALNRHNSNTINKRMNFIYCLNEYSNGTVTQTFIDPSCFGNIGRYLNHSCEPNCWIIPVRVDSPIPKLAIFSNKVIEPNSELTFDYSANYLECTVTDSLIHENNHRKTCLCKSEKCRKFMPFDIY